MSYCPVRECNERRRSVETLRSLYEDARDSRRTPEHVADALWDGWWYARRALESQQRIVALACAPWFDVEQGRTA